MDKHEFEQFVTEHGKDILRFCRMNAGSTERGNELYQDTMVITAMHSSTTDPGELAKLYDKVFKDTVITCTVTFNDGTSQKRQIGIGGAVMTYEELGTQTDEPVESPEDPSQKQAFLKLQIK